MIFSISEEDRKIMEILIRKIQGDEDLIFMAHLDTLAFGPDERWNLEAFHEKSKIAEMYIAVLHDGTLCGYCIYNKEKKSISGIAVLPIYQHQGIGRKMLEKICVENTEKISLHVNTKNIIAVKLYEKFNFKITEEHTDYYGNGINAYTMVRNI